jgi:hypothetical protein
MAMTGKIRPEDVTLEERQTAKPCNFGLLYKMGNRGFYNYIRAGYQPNIKADGTTAAVLVRVRRLGGYFCAGAMRPRLQHWGSDRDWFDRTACLARSSSPLSPTNHFNGLAETGAFIPTSRSAVIRAMTLLISPAGPISRQTERNS